MNFCVKKIAVVVVFFFSFFTINGQNIILEDTTSFFRNWARINKDSITWKFLSVPENWNDPNSKMIKVAISVIENLSNKTNADAVVFIQGGPGASGINNIGSWVNHPLREKNDIILFDIRGTGFSKPRLCPDLGEKFLRILAKNQSKEEDEKQKVIASLSCKQDLLNRDIDIKSYHSLSVSRDLNTLKKQLGYDSWHVYGASYGTYMAQVYANTYPNDIKTLSLDSSISNISTYYTKNTDNYVHSLSKIFKKCKDDIECNKQYPNLEKAYYKTIADLKKHPITVSVDKELIESGKFTYNSEDFKIAIQQALYNRKLVEVIPLLIYQFQNRNEDALGNLVAAFASLLEMDYGVYYCVSCNEVLPNNEIYEYQKNASKFRGLDGGVSFYESDFKVCDKWNLNRQDLIMYHDLSRLSNLSFPVLIFSGEYDPITPVFNGFEVAEKFKKAYPIIGFNYGHVPGFTEIGKNVVENFINDPSQTPDSKAFKKEGELNFIGDVVINSGVSKFGNSLSQFNLFFLSPLIVALGIMLVFIFTFITKLLRKRYSTNSDKIIRTLIVLTSITGIIALVYLVLALLKVVSENYFVLAFGLPENLDYVFTLLLIFVILLVTTLLYFIIRIKMINHRSIVFSLLFSNILLVTYLFYWGII
ncbi:alpha/beta fold hydrolase [Aquimarina sp. AU119]|uniref:alpha/beta fold hydrolase n=1 Tax=Aquimarina sp. AU119 TaxID=2108528 RepID=UPI000D688295|nr:alpha/beta fold hydrolase [Aquimarina sp. AU119]